MTRRSRGSSGTTGIMHHYFDLSCRVAVVLYESHTDTSIDGNSDGGGGDPLRTATGI